MVDEKGRATRLALSAAAWGERVPKNAEDAAKLAEKGRKLLERYGKTKKKDDSESVEEKQLPGQTIGQQSGGGIGATAQGSLDAIDHDGDGMINDGTPEEQRAPYKRQSNSDYEKRRRKFVRGQLAAQGIKPNRDVADRSQKERDARAKARAAFDKETVRSGAEAQAQIGRANTDAARDRRNQAQSDRLTGQAQRTSAADRKPADRYPNPEKKYPPGQKPSPSKPRDQKPADRYPNPTRPDRKPADRYPEPGRPIRPEDGVNNRPKPSPKSPSTTRPGADRSEPRTGPSATRPGADRSEPRTSPSAMRPGADRSEPRTSPSATRPGADRTDRSAPNRKPDSADRASRYEYKPGYILEDADGQLQQYDGRAPKDREYIKEQRDGTLQLYGPDKRTGANDKRRPDSIDRPNPNKIKPGYRRRDDIRPVGKPTIDRPKIGESRGGGRPTIDRPRLPGNQYKRTAGKNRNIRDF
jgi:hypothetical protein